MILRGISRRGARLYELLARSLGPFFVRFPTLVSGKRSSEMRTLKVVVALEYNYRHANVPYFSGRRGVTPPGGNVSPAGSVVPGWTPDLRKEESRLTFALL